MVIHDKNRRLHPCPYCEREFTGSKGLEYHVTHAHLGGGSEMCPFCATEVKNLKTHIKYMHEGHKDIKNFKCELPGCEHMSRTKSAAKIHFRTAHTDIKFECKICGTMVKNLSTHISQIHKNKDRYKCEHCDRAFSKRCDFRVHSKKVHNVEVTKL